MASAKSQKLEDQAATAALYVSKGKDNKSVTKPSKSSKYPLDEDNKLSSAAAATSLTHAEPQDLPAFPVVGITNSETSAGAAATLADQNKKTFEYWKPGDIPAANKAAMLAKDYKAAPLWHPELSAAGSKAALLAAKEGGDVKIWRPEPTDTGNSAAGQAMRMKRLSPRLDYRHTEDGEKRAMMAATQSMASSRKRAGSTPVEPPSLYPDSKNSAANALKAATSVSRGSPRASSATSTGPLINAGKIHNAAVTNLSREMYTSHPPVAPEIEEKNKQATLRASAVAMAQQMYNVQQRAIEAAAFDQNAADSRYGAAHAHNRPTSVLSDESHQVPQYANLQEAAQKLASERLAKLNDDRTAYRKYYGTQQTPQVHKLSIRGRTRRRASSDGQADEDDEERSRQIRNEMSLFTAKIDQVDNKKRQKDRDSLMAAAQRNVTARIQGMDEKVFNETGKVSPAMMAEWEAMARAKADADSSARMINHGKVNIGGGRYMDQADIDAIALTKVQPTLDEVTLAAERQRARDEEVRQQQLERERLAAEKDQDQRERDAKTKAAWKRFKEDEKREARARKEEEKARKVEEKRLRDEEKRKSRDAKVATKVPVQEEVVAETIVTEPITEPEPEPPALDPVPHVEPNIAAKEPKLQPLPGDEERIAPTFITMSEREEVTMSQANLPTAATEEPEPVPAVTAESGASGAHLSGDAATIAQRVFNAPFENEAISGPGREPPAIKAQEAANATETVEEAPVVKAEVAPVPTTETTAVTEVTPSLVTAQAPVTTQAPVIAEPSSTMKYDTPVAARVAPLAPQATMETTVTGGTSPKSKESKGVSSWLKTKFRRSSKSAKPAKPETTAPGTETKEKAFVGGANLTAPETTKTSSEQGESSIREVAMAGKETPVTPTISTEVPVVSPAEDEMYDASPCATGAVQRESSSPSISSLSSDEDTRGRSAVPRDNRQQLTQEEFVRQEAAKQYTGNVDPALGGCALDPALKGHGKTDTSFEGGDQEFEEAWDTFDSEKLSPPAVVGGERKSDSPARDSKFLEDL